MIYLTRLNGQRFVLNSDRILTVESNPDTVITLSGKLTIRVKESMDAVLKAVIRFRRRIFRSPGKIGGTSKP